MWKLQDYYLQNYNEKPILDFNKIVFIPLFLNFLVVFYYAFIEKIKFSWKNYLSKIPNKFNVQSKKLHNPINIPIILFNILRT